MSMSRHYFSNSPILSFTFLVCLACAGNAFSQEEQSPGIPNAEIHSAYANGNVIAYTFLDGKLEYQFVDGPMKGAFGRNLDFVSRHVDDEIYLVSWHDTNNAFYMTLVLDLQNNKEYFTSIIGYANESPQTNFLEADIIKVTFLE